MKSKYKKSGWFRESRRHSLARKGVKTGSRIAKGTVGGALGGALYGGLVAGPAGVVYGGVMGAGLGAGVGSAFTKDKKKKNKVKRLFTDVGWWEVKSDGIHKHQGYKKRGKYARMIKTTAPDKSISYSVHRIGKRFTRPFIVKGNLSKEDAEKLFNKIKDINFSKKKKEIKGVAPWIW